MRRDRRSVWQFSFKVLIPVIVAVLVTAGTAAGFVWWSATKSDDRALTRQTRLVEHILKAEWDYIAYAAQDATGWDYAVAAVRDGDDEWIDDNLGQGIYEAHSHNRIYVLDHALTPIYAMREGGAVDPTTFADEAPAILPVVEQLRGVDGDARIDAYNNGFADDGIPGVTDLGIVAGQPALISTVPILSWSDEYDVAPDEAAYHVVVRFLDGALAEQLMDQYLIDGARYDTTPALGANEAAVPLKTRAGDVLAWFKWQPERPGSILLQETAPAMAIAVIVAGLVIAILMRSLRRSSAELEAERARAQHQALHDPLTGLANRAMFQQRLTEALERLSPGSNPIALLALDLDRFKQVNDTLGHEAGDELLRQVAGRIKALIADNDTLARLGGDEFVILQSAIRTVNESSKLSEKIITRVSEPYKLAGTEVRIGVSIGVALAKDAASDGLDLPARADFALYQAKESGRNQFKLYDELKPEAAETQAA
jgi:diguanylate cyclase (GGDEF)-like protein